jgi:Protein of unknown function (DUF2934)
MFDSRASAAKKPKAPSVQKQPSSRVATIPDAGKLQSKIRERAHQLFESRGREHGHDKQDWTEAEHEILNKES